MTVDKLLKKTTFNPSTDHLIFTGDMVNKGPDSPGVIDLARKHSASCVRGNHEDQVLVIRHSMESDAQNYPNPGRPLTENSREGKLAGRLTSDQARWLDACPVILKVGQVPGMGEVVTVHGGLVPSVELGMQDPASVMSMRTINLETHVPSSSGNGKKWAKVLDYRHNFIGLF